MYLWKYWRESRILFLAVACINLGLFINSLRQQVAITVDFRPFSGVFLTLLYMLVVPFGFLAWLFGIFGVGRDIGEKSGSFLLTRPVKRSYFVWRDWGSGAIQLFLLIALANLLELFQMKRLLVAAGDPWHGGIQFTDGTIHSLLVIFSSTSIIIFLLAALIFSLTYFCTVVIKNARGVMLSAAVMVTYLFVTMRLIPAYWPHVKLPGLIPQQFTFTRGMISGFSHDLGLELAIRAAIVFIFPIAAQFVLERADI